MQQFNTYLFRLPKSVKSQILHYNKINSKSGNEFTWRHGEINHNSVFVKETLKHITYITWACIASADEEYSDEDKCDKQ